MLKKIFLLISIAIFSLNHFGMAQSRSFCLKENERVRIYCLQEEQDVVRMALSLLSRDLSLVLGDTAVIQEVEGEIMVITVQPDMDSLYLGVDLSVIRDKKQAFVLSVLPSGKLLIAGSDSHGTAYGIMELSRLLGVSPWEWWADVTPVKQQVFELPAGYQDIQFPSVEFRGIFINDEDWGLMPWSSLHYEPWNQPGRIGPKTHERIFELLLRLRANTYWPPMHECTLPFFLTEKNRDVAEKYGIYIGGSHCEPMASSTAGEWPKRGKGVFDYVNNRVSVYKFWEERVKEVAGQEILYTVGMRGVHDGVMNGAQSVREQKEVLEKVFADQRLLLEQYVDEDVTKVPQVFIPYKEVLDVYTSGLKVPEDITLMWCDDNYGYIKHFPTAEERARKGGNGVYYHISYWGRPHDYLWLGTFSPYLLYQQMKQAYDYDIRKIWILNVGDIKPAEYQIELFMDMAWNIEKVAEAGVTAHLNNFLCREFGEKVGRELLPVMQEHYRLAYIRKPEFMGNTREEEYHTNTYRIVKDLPWSRRIINERLSDYETISDKVGELASQIQKERKDAYFQLVQYPVQAATEMNKKMLYAQFARHGEMGWQRSDAAYDSIVSLTRIYNIGINNNGKWHRIMDHQPRRLPVFEPVDRSVSQDAILEDRLSLCHWNALECVQGDFIPCEGLGYEGKAVTVKKEGRIIFEFTDCPSDSVEVQVCLLPSHPVEGGQLRFTVALDDTETSPIHYETEGRSEEWKENVLKNQSVRRVILPVCEKKTHRLVIKALDEGVVVDQIFLFTHDSDRISGNRSNKDR